MRALLLLALLFGVPSQGMSKEYWQISCKDFEILSRNLNKSDVDPVLKHEVLIELIRATDPKCFS